MTAIARIALAAIATAFCHNPLQANAGGTVANVKGSYAFRFSGTDYQTTGKQIVATGVFTTDGKGGISAGSISYNDGGALCSSTTLIPTGSSYTIVTDGEGTLNLQFSAFTGMCPLQPTFDFAIAIAAPKSTIEQHIEMSSTTFSVSQDQTTPDVPVAGVAEHQ
jgi:hypothetical protein